MVSDRYFLTMTPNQITFKGLCQQPAQKTALSHRFLLARSTPMQDHSMEILDRFFSTVDWPTPFTEVSSWAE